MADEEVDADIRNLTDNLRELGDELLELGVSVQSSGDYCQRFCQTLVQYAGKWKISEDPLPLLEVYTVAIQSYSKARPYLTSECENVCFVLDRLALSCTELLLCLPDEVPDKLWEQFQASVQAAHKVLLEYANPELQMLATLAQEGAVWKNSILDNIFSQQSMEQDKVSEFLLQEGPALLEMRIRHLVKEKRIDQAMKLAKLCTDHPEIGTKSIFKQTYLTCLCAASPNETLMEEISTVDCKDALEMICNLESDGEEKTALILCTTFLTRQLQQGDLYCAWELTLFWSKLQQRMEPSAQTFLECCRQFSMLSKTVYHIFFLIKVIQSEAGEAGLSSCIELCVRALRMESNENPTVKTSICKTISCLLPDDLEVRRACQLTEFLLEPTVEAYYAVETLYNQPDQKYDDENGPIPNSLRCELLLVLKTHWPFDPEFWDWKTLKRHCLALMGEEASIVSSIDELNDSDLFDENNESHNEVEAKEHSLNGLPKFYSDMVKVQNYSPEAMIIKKEKEEKKIERGVVSARFKNWQAYMQYCVLCDREFLGHRIIRHAQTHMKDGNYYCPICAKSFKKKEIFVPHVTFHIKQSCKERLAAIKPKRRVGRPPKNITDNSASPKMTAIDKQEHRPIKRNSLYGEDFVVFSDSDGSDDEGKDKSYKPDITATQKVDCTEDYNCPVTICTKTFKYFKNLIAHVKGHSNEEEAKQFLKMQSNKVVCQYCRRRFVSVSHLNEHLQIHCGPKPYVCIQLECSASFGTYSELVGHRKEHILFKAKCMFQNCGRIFTESYLLYDHEAQHYHSSSYTCRYPNCGKICFSQSEIQKHEAGHVANVRIKTEDQNSSSFESSQITDNATEQVGNQIDQLLETIVENNKTVKQFDINNYDMSLTYEKPQQERRLQTSGDKSDCGQHKTHNQSDSYHNGFAVGCTTNEIKSKPVAQELHSSSTNGDQNSLPNGEYANKVVKTEELNHNILSETMFKGDGMFTPMLPKTSVETVGGEVVESLQRFNCKVEGCSRSYTLARSVSKHIKAVHPEYYEALKKKENLAKVQRIRNPLKCQNQDKPANPSCLPDEQITNMLSESSQNAVNQQLVTSVLKVENGNVSQPRKKRHTHNKRAKWPAIIKGDKFICSRCYREFTNPKSLGGHLSRRAICKPYDGNESTSNVGQKNGQALYQTEKILSTSAFTPQARDPPYIPDTFLTGETFLQSFEMGDSATSFGAHEIFSSTHESSYNSTVFESSKSLQQALEDAGTASTFETEVIQQTFQTSFDTNAVEDNPAMASNMAMSQALKAVCSPGPFVATEGINAEVSPMLNPVKDTALFSPCESLQQTLESNFCSGPYVGNEINPQDLESNCEAPMFVANEPLPEIINATTTCNYIAPFTQGSVPDATCNTSSSEESKTFDTRIAELLMGLQNLNLESDAKLFSSNGMHGSSMNIMAHASTNHCTENPDLINPCLTTPQTNTQQEIAQTENNKELKVNLVKPFVCQDEGCIYSAMTKDALTNHYVKVHQYSRERIMEIKMYQTRFAPFRCHVPNCQKTFTRNSNLRAHYQSVHHVAREELVKLRIKRAYCRKPEGSDKTAESVQPVKEIISQPAIINSQEKDSKCHTELESVAIGPNEFGPYLHSTQNTQTVLCNDGMPQDDLVLLAGLQNGLVLPAGPQEILVAAAGLPHNSALAVEPHVATLLVASTPAAGPQSVSLLPAGLQSVSLILPEPENSSLLSAGPQDILGPQMVLPQVSPLPIVPQVVLPQVSSLPIDSEVLLSPISPLPMDLQVALPLVSSLPTCPQVVLPQVSPMPAGPQVVLPLPVGSEISSPLSTMPQVVLPLPAGPNVVSSLQEATVQTTRSEVILAHMPGVSMQQNNPEGDLNQAQNIECTLNQAHNLGEKKRRKAITKIKAQYDANKFHKPYKCVHKGCSAAFTIQQNLILHYRAVHQSDQHLLLRSEIKEESTQNESIQIRKEFSCQLDDCCRIFQGVTDLIKHYAELHDLALDEMGKLVSSMSEGKFHCDQAQCMSSFTVFWSFIKHLLVAHGIDVESKDSDQEMACFKCDCEGCDRTYATRSNLLRHIFTKHRELHRSHLMRPRRIIPTDQENIARTASQEDLSDGKDYLGSEEFSENEDVENHGKSKPVSRECFTSDSKNLNGGEVDDSKSYSSRKIGKYTFKSKAQALAMCSCKSLREQFPCMFESCSSVVTSESSLVKHYRIHHKISNTFVSQYYNHLVTCRTYSSAQGKESTEYVSNGQEGSVENAIYGDVVQQQVKLSETEILNKRVEKNDLLKSSFDELSEMFNAKLVNDTNGSAENKTGLEKMVEVSADNKFTNVNNHQPCKKRSNIHLTHSDIEKECVQSKKKKNLVMEKPEQLLEDNVNRTLHEKVASPAPDNSPCLNKGQHHKTFDLSTFKPMGFEVSFLKFLEESAVKRKRKPVAYKGPCHSGSTANAGKMADGGLHSSKVMAGNNSSSATRAMRGDERSGVPFNHSKESAVNRLCVETTEPQTLTNFSNPLSLHILKNIKVIMDKTHLDCVELAQKQLQRMQPTVVLSRIKVDVNMLAQVKRMKESIALKSK